MTRAWLPGPIAPHNESWNQPTIQDVWKTRRDHLPHHLRLPELAKTGNTQRHDEAAAYLHWKIRREYQIKTTEKWYEHQPQTVTENQDVTIFCDMPIQKVQQNRRCHQEQDGQDVHAN